MSVLAVILLVTANFSDPETSLDKLTSVFLEVIKSRREAK